MACRSATIVATLLLLSFIAVARSRPIEAVVATDDSSAVAVAPREVLPSSSGDVSTVVVPVPSGQDSGHLQLPSESEHSIVVYRQDAVEAEDLGRKAGEEVVVKLPVADPDTDHKEEEPSTDGEEEEEELLRSQHSEDDEEERAMKPPHNKDDDDDSDSDSDDDDDDDLEEKAKRWMKAFKKRWLGHRQHHNHNHGHRHALEAAGKQADDDSKQEKSGVMMWIKGVVNRF